MKITGAFLVAIISTLTAIASVAQAAEVKVVGSTGLNAVISELVSKFESSTGHKVSLGTPALAADVKKRIEGGEAIPAVAKSPSGRIMRFSRPLQFGA